MIYVTTFYSGIFPLPIIYIISNNTLYFSKGADVTSLIFLYIVLVGDIKYE